MRRRHLAIAVLITILLAVLLGAPAVRLLCLAVRTKQLPELLAGIFFTGAGIGVPLRVLGASWALGSPEAATLPNAVGHILFATGASALYLFTCIVFRRASANARMAASLGIFAVLASTVWVFVDGVNSEETLSVLVTNFSRVAALAWAFVESRRYASLMRRRVALGLGDPVVADRFRLWSIWTGALTVGPLMAAIGRLLSHAAVSFAGDSAASQAHALIDPAIHMIRLLTVLSAPVAVYGIWMSFFPPARYLAHIRDAASPTDSGASSTP